MVLKEDCINFRYIEKKIPGLGDPKRIMQMPNCRINKMSIGACPNDCSFFEQLQD